MESGGYEVTYVPNHHAQDGLPFTGQEYAAYDAVILSDIGSNTLLLPSATFGRSEKRPNRCQAIRDYVLDGGALVMIGGYMSFTGITLKRVMVRRPWQTYFRLSVWRWMTGVSIAKACMAS